MGTCSCPIPTGPKCNHMYLYKIKTWEDFTHTQMEKAM